MVTTLNPHCEGGVPAGVRHLWEDVKVLCKLLRDASRTEQSYYTMSWGSELEPNERIVVGWLKQLKLLVSVSVCFLLL